MISFSFNIFNPWNKTWKNLWCRSYSTPFNNKFIELEVIRDSTIVSFMFRLATQQSHGGLSLELGILSYSFNFQFYDSRHWDVENNCWEVYGQPD